MANRIKPLLSAAFGLCLSIVSATTSASAQTTSSSAFEQIAAYANAFESLDSEVSAHLSARALMLKERDEVRAGLIDTQRDLQEVQARGFVNQFQALETAMDLESIMQYARSVPAQSPSPLWRSTAFPLLANQTASDLLAQLSLQNQSLQLDAAASLTLERQRKLLTSAQGLVRRAQAWMVADRELMAGYIELADISGTRSRLERRAALRQLERGDSQNIGAEVARAITLMRLGRVAEARQLVDECFQRPGAALPFLLAVSGELHARAGEKTPAKKSLNEAIRQAPNVPILYWLRAQSLMVMKEVEPALTDWELLLKSGQHDIAAHRGLALAYCALPTAAPRNRELALEHAKLAVGLAGTDDWSCQVALALATARSGDLAGSITLAESAAQSALAEQKFLCASLAEQLKSGQIPDWEF
jgi:tetratricopeptide (TPR) repeat protein